MDTSTCERILVADDNDGTREALVEALNAHGYQTIGARNGKEAIEKLHEFKSPTLIFMDLMMPVMDGWETLHKLQADPTFPDLKVVTLSAVNFKSRTDAKIPQNTVASLSKPISLKSVLELAKKYCGTPARPSRRSPPAETHP